MESATKLDIAVKIWGRIVGQVTSVLSTVVFACILEFSPVIAAAGISITLGLGWIVVDSYARRYTINNSGNKNEYWKEFLLDLYDFIYSIFVYLIIQWIKYYISVSDALDSDDFASQIVTSISTVAAFMLIVTLSNSLKDTEKDVYGPAHTFSRIWMIIFGPFAQFFSETFLGELTEFPNQLFAGIIALMVLLCFLFSDSTIRKLIESIEVGERRTFFKNFLFEIMDFCYTVAIFVFIYYFNILISIETSATFAEKFVSIFSLAIFVYSVFGIMSAISLKKSGVYQPIDTAFRIWGRISGTVSGIFASILITYADDSNDRQAVILVMIVIALAFPFIDGYIRNFIDSTAGIKRNYEWTVVLKELLDLAYSFSFLIPLNFYSEYLIKRESDANITISEKLVLTFALSIAIYAIFSVLKSIQSQKVKNVL